MKKYSVFELWVVKVDDYYFICEKTYKKGMYKEIFTDEKFEVLDEKNIEPLKNYYSLFERINYTTGEILLLTKKELLVRYAEINYHQIKLRKQHDNSENLSKGLSEYLEGLKELAKINPKLAREEAMTSLRRTGVIDENGKFTEPYGMLSLNEEHKCNDGNAGKSLIIKKSKNNINLF